MTLTRDQIIEKAKRGLKAGDVAEIVVARIGPDGHPYSVHIDCRNRLPWQSYTVRGGWTNRVHVGSCKTEETAARLVARIQKKLEPEFIAQERK